MWGFLPSAIILGSIACVAARLAQKHPSPVQAASQRLAASRVLGIATLIQGAHFSEEWLTGFHARFPALFGLEPMPLGIFVLFNLAWLAIWILSIPRLRQGHRLAFFAAWFLAIAAILNGVAHPLMAVSSVGYFPGLMTSPFIGVAGVILLMRLRKATSAPQWAD